MRNGQTLCPLHSGVGDEGEAHAQLEAISWVVRQVDAAITGAVRGVCEHTGQEFAADPVRPRQVGVARAHVWERAWKACSDAGSPLRVAVVIAESDPATCVTKVNANVVATAALPPRHTRRRADAEDGETQPEVVAFRDVITREALSAIASWGAIERSRRAGDVHLSGASQRTRVEV